MLDCRCLRRSELQFGHPEMVGEGTDLAHCLLEGVLDLEAQAVETKWISMASREVSVHMRRQAPLMQDGSTGDEAHQPAGGTPQQVADPILDDHLALAVDGAWGWLEVAGGLPQGAELLILLPYDPGAAFACAARAAGKRYRRRRWTSSG